jgi:hypothetical protein
LDSSGRNIGNEKVSNGRKRKETILVDRTREREGKVKGLYSEKEQEMLKKKKQLSVKQGWIAMAVRKVMG